MGRNLAEQSNALSIFWLKKEGILDCEYKSGVVTWTFGFSENKSSIGYTLVKNSDNGNYIQLNYTQTDRWSGEKTNLDYRIELTTTPCYFGGKRYWFVCPLSKNGKYCGRRVGVIYNIGKYYGCRHCGNVAYSAQAESKKFRGCTSVCAPDIDKAEAEVKRKYYNGKATRKYKRLIRLEDKFNYNFFRAAGVFRKEL